MRHVLEELFDLLIEQKSVLSNMLELSQEERRIIISGEIEKLEGIVRLELHELSKLNAIEKKRSGLHKSIAAELDLSGDDVTISMIALSAQPDEREIIMKLQSELIALIEQHTNINMENMDLIKAHLEYSETMLELMVESEDPLNSFYGGDGKVAQTRKRTTGFFNSHA